MLLRTQMVRIEVTSLGFVKRIEMKLGLDAHTSYLVPFIPRLLEMTKHFMFYLNLGLPSIIGTESC